MEKRRKNNKIQPHLWGDRKPLHGREWPSDDGKGMWGHGARSTLACWDCKVTARASIEKIEQRCTWTTRGRERQLYPRSGICQHCGGKMRDMGNKWRPGRHGKWLTDRQIDAISIWKTGWSCSIDWRAPVARYAQKQAKRVK